MNLEKIRTKEFLKPSKIDFLISAVVLIILTASYTTFDPTYEIGSKINFLGHELFVGICPVGNSCSGGYSLQSVLILSTSIILSYLITKTALAGYNRGRK
ncbi:MAG: hypothetical protein H8Z69_02270 [Nanohaloarchaea archaeon]|nr:hypothetical protein [Candidatus Nanohaloarchaea archaeon]